MNAPTDTLYARRPFRFDGVEYAAGDRFSPNMADPKVARKVDGLQRRRFVDLFTRSRRKGAANVS
jgi:hypothetical protein